MNAILHFFDCASFRLGGECDCILALRIGPLMPNDSRSPAALPGSEPVLESAKAATDLPAAHAERADSFHPFGVGALDFDTQYRAEMALLTGRKDY